MEGIKEFDITLSKDNYVLDYLKLVTLNVLTPTEYKVLAEICGYESLGRREKVKIRNRLELSVYSLNNIISSLNKKGIIQQNREDKRYKSMIHIPKKVCKVIFNLKVE